MPNLTLAQIIIIIVTQVTHIESSTTTIFHPTAIDVCLENITTKVNVECASSNRYVKYHCLPYGFTYIFGTICTEWKLIGAGYCPYLNSYQNQLDVRKCVSEFECPNKSYRSYESFKYKGCFRQLKPTTSPPPTTTESKDTTITSNGNDNGITWLQGNTAVIFVVIVIPAITIAIQFILVTYLICKTVNHINQPVWMQYWMCSYTKCREVKKTLPKDATYSKSEFENENEETKPLFKGSTQSMSDSGNNIEKKNLLKDAAYTRPESENEKEEMKHSLNDGSSEEMEQNKATSVEKLTAKEVQMRLQLAQLMSQSISKLLYTMIDNVTDDSFEKIIQNKYVQEYLCEKFKSDPYILANLCGDDNGDDDDEMADEVPVEVLYSILMEMIPELKDDDKTEINVLKEGGYFFQSADVNKQMGEFENCWQKTKSCIEHLDKKYESGIFEKLDKREKEFRDISKQDSDESNDLDNSDLSIMEAKLHKIVKLAIIMQDAIFTLLCNILTQETNEQLSDILSQEEIKQFLKFKIELHEYLLLYGEDGKLVIENLTCSSVFSIVEECLGLYIETVTEIRRLKAGMAYFDEVKGTEEEEEVKEKWIELAKSVKVLDDLYKTGVYKDMCDDAKQYMPKLE